MKLAYSSAPVEVSGGSETSQFSIAMNAKAFKVLSDTLYQNKIGSIVRELSCNAKDSHVAANQELPFVIHLPDTFEPWFSVKDFGLGLSPESITSIFTVYFQSTKADDNSAIGAFGLGAKTPFSYTDQFTVTSVFSGVRYIYSAYINGEGMPTIVEMDRSETNDCNGVEIKMSVKTSDFYKFRTETNDQLRFFDQKPLIENCKGFSFDNGPFANLTVLYDEADFVLYNSRGYYNDSSYIIQGGVGYPLNYSEFINELDPENKKFIEAVMRNVMVMRFEIGEIGVTASREAVEYNKHTISSINARITKIRNFVINDIKTRISTLSTEWERVEFLNNSTICSLNVGTGQTVKLDNAENIHWYYQFTPFSEFTNQNGKYAADLRAYVTYKVQRTQAPIHIVPKSGEIKYYFALRDTYNRPNIRAKYFLDSLKNDKAILIEINLNDSSQNADHANIFAHLSEKLGGYPVDNMIRLSDIELPATVSNKTTKRYNNPRAQLYKQVSTKSNVRNWEKEFCKIASITDSVVYVAMDNMKVSGKDQEYIEKYIRLRGIVGAVPTLYAIRVSDVKKIENNSNFVELGTYIERKVSEFNSPSRKREWKRYQQAWHIYQSNPFHRFTDEFVELLKTELPDASITRIISKVRTIVKGDNQNTINIAVFLGWDENNCDTSQCDKILENITKSYPLLSMFKDWSIRNVMDNAAWIRYIKAMSQFNKNP